MGTFARLAQIEDRPACDDLSTVRQECLEQSGGVGQRGRQLSADVYQMVLAEIEAPLLKEIMGYTRNNETKASIMLGLNRGTLRKKLRTYSIIQ